MPDLLHVVPVGDDAVLDGVLQGEDTPLGLGLVSNVGVLLSHADHDSLVTGAANDGGEDSSGGVIAGEASLAHAGAVVDDQGSNIIVTHVGGLVECISCGGRVSQCSLSGGSLTSPH